MYNEVRCGSEKSNYFYTLVCPCMPMFDHPTHAVLWTPWTMSYMLCLVIYQTLHSGAHHSTLRSSTEVVLKKKYKNYNSLSLSSKSLPPGNLILPSMISRENLQIDRLKKYFVFQMLFTVKVNVFCLFVFEVYFFASKTK